MLERDFGESSRSKRERETLTSTSTSTSASTPKQKQTKIEEKNETKDEGSESDLIAPTLNLPQKTRTTMEKNLRQKCRTRKRRKKALVQEKRVKNNQTEETRRGIKIGRRGCGLNSKERRKLLRQLAAECDQAFLDRVTEASKKLWKRMRPSKQ